MVLSGFILQPGLVSVKHDKARLSDFPAEQSQRAHFSLYIFCFSRIISESALA